MEGEGGVPQDVVREVQESKQEPASNATDQPEAQDLLVASQPDTVADSTLQDDLVGGEQVEPSLPPDESPKTPSVDSTNPQELVPDTNEAQVGVPEANFGSLTLLERADRALNQGIGLIRSLQDSFPADARPSIEAALNNIDTSDGIQAAIGLLSVRADGGDTQAGDYLQIITPALRIVTPDGRVLTLSEWSNNKEDGVWGLEKEVSESEELPLEELPEDGEQPTPEANPETLLNRIIRSNIPLVEAAAREAGRHGQENLEGYISLIASLRLADMAHGELAVLQQAGALSALRANRIPGTNSGELDAVLESLRPAVTDAQQVFSAMIENSGLPIGEVTLLSSLPLEVALKRMEEMKLLDKMPDLLQRVYGPDVDEKKIQETAKVDLKNGIKLSTLLWMLAGISIIGLKEGGKKLIHP